MSRALAAPQPSRAVKVERTSIARLGLSFIVAAALAVGLAQTTEQGDLAGLVPLFIAAIYVQLLPLLWSSDPDVFSPPALSGFVTAFALIASFVTAMQSGLPEVGLMPMLPYATQASLIQSTLLAYIFGTLAYYVGYYAKMGTGFARIFPDLGGYEWSRKKLIVVSLFCLALAIPAYAYFQARTGIALTDITQLAEGKRMWAGEQTLTWMMRGIFMLFIPVLLVAALVFQKPTVRGLILVGGMAVVAAFLVTRLGQRGNAVFFGLSLLVLVHYLYRRIPIKLLVALLFAAIVVTNALGEYRRGAVEPRLRLTSEQLDPVQALSEHDADRRRLDAMAVIFYHFPDHREHLMGESYLAFFMTPVPRWLLPNKSDYMTMRETAIIWELVGAPVPANFLGTLYANFSWLGIVFGMAGWGMFQRGLYTWFQRRPKDPNTVLFYGAMLVNFSQPTMLAISAALQFVLPVWVALRFMRVPRRISAGPSAETASPKA